MFETAFQKFCKRELQRLLRDWDCGLDPYNSQLDKVICVELTKQFFADDKAA